MHIFPPSSYDTGKRNMKGNSMNSCKMQTMQSMQNMKGQGMCFPKFETAKDMTVAMAYVPWQTFSEVYEPDKALRNGTVFPELNKPFKGRGCNR